MKKLFGGIFGALVSAGFFVNSHAEDFSFVGSFEQDDDVQLFYFSVASTSNVTLRSYSYAGGTQADGNVVVAGGFDPILSLFDSSGAYINDNDDGECSQVGTDPVSGECYDVYFEEILSAGDYTVAITQYDNFPNGSNLSDGFQREGQPNFTGGWADCSNGQFCDVNDLNRTSDWAFDLLNVNEATIPQVPLPAAFWLFGSGIFGLAALRQRSQR